MALVGVAAACESFGTAESPPSDDGGAESQAQSEGGANADAVADASAGDASPPEDGALLDVSIDTLTADGACVKIAQNSVTCSCPPGATCEITCPDTPEICLVDCSANSTCKVICGEDDAVQCNQNASCTVQGCACDPTLGGKCN